MLVDIIGNGNDCLKIAWTEIIENKDIQTLFERACDQKFEIKALIETESSSLGQGSIINRVCNDCFVNLEPMFHVAPVCK